MIHRLVGEVSGGPRGDSGMPQVTMSAWSTSGDDTFTIDSFILFIHCTKGYNCGFIVVVTLRAGYQWLCSCELWTISSCVTVWERGLLVVFVCNSFLL